MVTRTKAKNIQWNLWATSALFLVLTLVQFNIQAQTTTDCGCSIVVKPGTDGGAYLNGTTLKVLPGSKVCITAGKYKYINLFNFNGTALKPIQIVNCGGQVVVSGPNYGIAITKSSYFRVTGTGTPGLKYGFKITTAATTYMPSGVGIAGTTTDFEIDNIEIHKAGVGVICKVNPTCDASTWEAAYTMRNVKLHDLYLHNIEGEAFYVGHTSKSVTLTCNAQAITVIPQKINGLKIYNNIVDTAGWDGIQVASTPVNAEIYNNTVKNYGFRNQSSQQAGILLGGMSNGKVYNNHVENGTGNGIQVLGVGYMQIYNNVLINVGGNNVVSLSMDGIFIDDRPVPGYPAPSVNVSNNTVIYPRRTGIRLENSNKTFGASVFNNNIVVGSREPNEAFKYLAIRNNAPYTAASNISKATVAEVKFVDPAGSNYRLTSSSIAVDAGVNVSAFGITLDKDGSNRLVGTKTDAGAFEYKTTTTGAASESINATEMAGAAGIGVAKASVYPNPAVSTIQVRIDAPNQLNLTTIKIYDVRGVLVHNEQFFKTQQVQVKQVDIAKLIPGMYIVEVEIDKNKNIVQKFLKK